jgi:hypothetical protein
MRDVHADPDLSAYLDGELGPDERTRVEAHLAGCDRCSRRLAELRATASLMAALPYTRAPRSLVPAVAQRWTWLRPVRSLSTFASGAFLFVFLLTAVARSGAGLMGAGAPSAAQVNVPASSAAVGAGGLAEATAVPRAAPAAAPTPAPTAVPAPAFGAVDSAQQRTTAASAAPTAAATALTDAQKRAEAASPTVANAPQEEILRQVRGVHEPAPNPLLDPLVWLALAILAAVLAIVAHVRLRSA